MSLSFSPLKIPSRPLNPYLSFPDPLPVPVLSTDPSYDVYYEGERVAFICTAPTMKSVDGFRFFNRSGDQVYKRTSYSHTIAWFQLTAAKASAMEYTCMYWVKDAGREILSNRSLPLSINVQGMWVLCCL